MSTGNGTNSGALRVTIASDSTGVVALTTGSSWVGNAQIGDGTHTVTLNSSTYSSKYGLDANLLGTLGTAFSTAGKVDVKIASGDGVIYIKGNGGATLDIAQGGATAATNAVQVAGVYNTSLPTLTNGQGGAVQLDSSGRLFVNCATGCSASSTIALVPATSGGLTLKHFVAAASDNATSAKASAGQLYEVHVYNNAAYPVYLKLYNSASSPTGCGSSNLKQVFGVQAGTEFHAESPEGWAYAAGIGYCLTKGITDADDTAVLVSDAVADLAYD